MATIKEIAEMAGVSTTTVSNVIHGKTKRVSPSTIEKVVSSMKISNFKDDTVIDELKKSAKKFNISDENLSFAMAVYMLGFSTYNGFQ